METRKLSHGDEAIEARKPGIPVSTSQNFEAFTLFTNFSGVKYQYKDLICISYTRILREAVLIIVQKLKANTVFDVVLKFVLC